MVKVRKYWSKVAARAWRRSLELVRLESWERATVFLIGLLVPAVAVWLWVGQDAATTIRVLASLGASFLAVAVMFGWSLIALPATMDAEAEAARKELEDQKETAEQRRKKQDMLGEFLARGTALMSATRKYEVVPPEDEANEWLNDLIEYLKVEFGPAYVARVNDGGSAPVGYEGQNHKEHDRLFNGIRIRTYHLQEFLKELSR